MPNDIKKLRRLMRTAHVLQEDRDIKNCGKSFALKRAWWFESFRDAISNGFARFTYYKKDGTTRTALGTRAPSLIPVDKLPKCPQDNDGWEDSAKTIPYFDLDKNEWRSFNVLNFISLDKSWKFNDPVA
jgi:hypothetical protein